MASDVNAAMKRHPGSKACIDAPDFSEGDASSSEEAWVSSRGRSSFIDSSEGVAMLNR
jgi:hypothetical protein